jgi:hypothetical protein
MIAPLRGNGGLAMCTTATSTTAIVFFSRQGAIFRGKRGFWLKMADFS